MGMRAPDDWHHQAVRRLRSDADMLVSGIPWDERKRPLWQQIGSETFNHWPEHTADIERARTPA